LLRTNAIGFTTESEQVQRELVQATICEFTFWTDFPAGTQTTRGHGVAPLVLGVGPDPTSGMNFCTASSSKSACSNKKYNHYADS